MSGYKRSIILVNPRFQIKFSVIVCSLVWISSLVYPFTILELFESFTKMNPQAKENLAAAKSELLIFLGTYQLIYVGIVFVICIFLTHKIAGPMYKITQHLRDIVHGGPVAPVTFRNGDNFPEVAEEVNNVIEKFADEREDDFAYLTEISSYINSLALVIPEDKKPVLSEINARLQEIQTKLRPKE